MSYTRFRWLTGITIAAFVLIILLWRPISGFVVDMTGCSRVGGACGAVLTLFGLHGRLALTALVTLVFAVIITLRSRTLGLPLIATLTGVVAFAHLLPLTNAINNFWGAAFVTGTLGLGGIFSIIPLGVAIAPTIVSVMVFWNLASRRREEVFRNYASDPFLMRALKIFSGLFLAGYIVTFLKFLAIVPGMQEIVRSITKALMWPNLVVGAVNLILGVGVIAFLWYLIGRDGYCFERPEDDRLYEEDLSGAPDAAEMGDFAADPA